MPGWGSIIGAAAGGATGAAALGWARERRVRADLLRRLDLSTPGGTAPATSAAEVPAPVARYLELAVPAGVGPIARARFRQSGRLRTDPDTDRWMDFTATHIAAPLAPGFLWDARVSAGPLHVRVVDAFVEGSGVGRVSLQSAVALGRSAASAEIDEASLQRLLAEGPWTPSLLAPSARLSWTARSSDAAVATLTVGRTEVRLEFTFDAAGRIVRTWTPGRWRAVRGGFERCGWEGRFSDYVDHDGWRIPRSAEVGWHIGGEPRSVFECTLDSIDFEIPT